MYVIPHFLQKHPDIVPYRNSLLSALYERAWLVLCPNPSHSHLSRLPLIQPKVLYPILRDRTPPPLPRLGSTYFLLQIMKHSRHFRISPPRSTRRTAMQSVQARMKKLNLIPARRHSSLHHYRLKRSSLHNLLKWRLGLSSMPCSLLKYWRKIKEFWRVRMRNYIGTSHR